MWNVIEKYFGGHVMKNDDGWSVLRPHAHMLRWEKNLEILSHVIYTRFTMQNYGLRFLGDFCIIKRFVGGLFLGN
jgi:hypothetical protein